MFKETFKYYKRKVPPPDLNKVLDLSVENVDFSKVTIKSPYQLSIDNGYCLDELGLNPINQWKMFEIQSHPGLKYIVNPFTAEGQRHWIYKALAIYPKPPNKLNLHAHNDLSTHEDWWHICQISKERKLTIYKKLRWVTLGYHHNWDTKVYSESDKSEFPLDLRELSRLIVKVSCNYDLEPQAAIVNYYNIGSTLSGHTDHSETNLEAPLLSLSFGQEAIFMIGGRSIDDECEALLVKSGDIIVMSGESRLCYHGVPLIRKTEEKAWHSRIEEPAQATSWTPFEDYNSTSRLNINVRQVLNSGVLHL